MMNMRAASEQFINEVQELMDIAIKKMMEDVDITDIDVETFTMMKKYMELMNSAKRLTLMQADMMDNINEKLDKLLARKEIEA